ncbi:MAG: hypothetical protein SPD90_13790 [Intestinibacter sp.]|uniref:hypothetical protein n=1 Tax=Intestinibacter sp. TaxID=1965304 RepID=UPI002A800F4D|nr:hypothetical protein [Intestinibacter sp.]MDY4576116.1 hypothetical protein [Intestinibacter sp.]
MKSIFSRILKVIITSFLICFFSGIVLMIANKIMGVGKIGIIWYLLLGGLCFVMLSVGLIFTGSEYIFKRKSPKKVNKNTDKKVSTRTKSIQRKNHRQKIS